MQGWGRGFWSGMQTFFLRYFRLVTVFVLVASLGLADFNLDQIPNGYAPGRSTAPYGAYSTPYTNRAKQLSDLLDRLEPKVYGLSQYSVNDEIEQSKAVYYMEHIVIGLLQEINSKSSGLSAFESQSLLYRTTQLYSHVRKEGERLYESMIRKVDIALPGPNGAQHRFENKLTGEVYYTSNCRSEKCPTREEQKEFYEKKLKDFLSNGGSIGEMRLLTPQYLREHSNSILRVEYAQRVNGEVWVTEGSAGHALLAEGKPVKTAGQMVFVLNRIGNPVFVVISNASGTYKPDLYSANILGQELAKKFSFHTSAIFVTEGEPLSQQTIKVLMKAQGVASDEIKKTIEDLNQGAKNILAHPRKPVADCKGLFAKIK